MKKAVLIKRFTDWHNLKIKIHNSKSEPVWYKERDIWWVSIGHNIGTEEDGKGKYFNRPVLVIKGFSRF
jgi:mRNA interferase MazF